ncbi:MAG: sugar phosphate isomerase/epimerase, partial [bacterium]|nr:sugar phosphate isomerase/epimerase [bacterium]
IRDCFAKLGPWIVSCHAKDIILRDRLALHLDETRPGTGHLDYRTYLRELERHSPKTPLIIEHLATAEDYAAARDYIKATAAELA